MLRTAGSGGTLGWVASPSVVGRHLCPRRSTPRWSQCMSSTSPTGKDRRRSPRGSPRYTPTELDELRIIRVHFRDEFLFCLLSDGNMICVPLAILPALDRAPHSVKYKWQLADDGKAIIWYLGAVGLPTEHLTLARIMSHPEAQITELPSAD